MLGIDVYYTITIPAWFITRKYHINETILLVLVRALLESRSRMTSHNNKTYFFHSTFDFFRRIKQIDFILPCVCTVIDHGRR